MQKHVTNTVFGKKVTTYKYILTNYLFNKSSCCFSFQNKPVFMKITCLSGQNGLKSTCICQLAIVWLKNAHETV